MSFDTAESSVDSSEPAYLLEFRVFNQVFRYTTLDRDVTFDAELWVHSEGLKISEVIDDGRLDNARVNITAKQDFYISTLYDPFPPDQNVGIRIRRLQVAENEAQYFWFGNVISVEWPENAIVSVLRTEHEITSLRRRGLRRRVQHSCPFQVYGVECKADPAPHTVSITVDAVAGRRIFSSGLSALGDGFGNGGVVYWENPVGRMNWRGTWSHVDDHLDLTYPSPITPGTVVTLKRGCDHSYATCDTVFDNAANHGGFPFFVGKNPYDGRNSIF